MEFAWSAHSTYAHLRTLRVCLSLEGRSADLSPSQSRTCGAARHPCFSCRNCETRSWTLRSTARESLQPPETLTSVASQRKHAGGCHGPRLLTNHTMHLAGCACSLADASIQLRGPQLSRWPLRQQPSRSTTTPPTLTHGYLAPRTAYSLKVCFPSASPSTETGVGAGGGWRGRIGCSTWPPAP